MAAAGATTRIEPLLFGNYPTWKAQVDVIFHRHGLREATNSSVSQWSVAESPSKGMSECRMVSVLIRALVSPTLLKHLSLRDVDDPASLLRELERISVPWLKCDSKGTCCRKDGWRIRKHVLYWTILDLEGAVDQARAVSWPRRIA
jgi:hypothetical protein